MVITLTAFTSEEDRASFPERSGGKVRECLSEAKRRKARLRKRSVRDRAEGVGPFASLTHKDRRSEKVTHFPNFHKQKNEKNCGKLFAKMSSTHKHTTYGQIFFRPKDDSPWEKPSRRVSAGAETAKLTQKHQNLQHFQGHTTTNHLNRHNRRIQLHLTTFIDTLDDSTTNTY